MRKLCSDLPESESPSVNSWICSKVASNKHEAMTYKKMAFP